MSAVSNFLEIFFPEYLEGQRQKAIARNQVGIENALSKLGPQQVQTPFQADTFGPEDPLAQLQAQGKSGLFQNQEMPGLFSKQEIGTLAGFLANPATRQFGQAMLGQVLPQQQKPTNLMQNFAALQQMRQNNPALATEFQNILMKPQVQINQGDKILGGDAKNWMSPTTGERASPTDTIEQATAKGMRPISTEEQKSMLAGQSAAPIVGALADVAFGENSLFPSDKAPLANRFKSYAESYTKGLTQSDENIVKYNTLKEAFVSQLARLSGQVGTLTDRDVGLVRGLFPVAGFTPESIAKSQFKEIARLLSSKGVPKETLKEFGLPDWALESKPWENY